MENGIGRRFMELTRYEHLTAPGEKRGVPQPPLERGLVEGNVTPLPEPDRTAGEAPGRLVSLHDAIEGRRSLRAYDDAPLSLSELAFLLRMTQGVQKVGAAGRATLRTVPSAGARHALETLLCVRRVEGLAPGLYQYSAVKHELVGANPDPSLARKLADACLGQEMVAASAVTFAWVAVAERMTWRYGERGFRYLHLDAGHICQNLYLACGAVGLGVCAIAAFDDAAVARVLGVDGEEVFPVYLASVGRPAPAKA